MVSYLCFKIIYFSSFCTVFLHAIFSIFPIIFSHESLPVLLFFKITNPSIIFNSNYIVYIIVQRVLVYLFQ